MTGDTLNYKRYLAITFGQNFQIHEEENSSKNTRNNTRGAICMSPRENKQGGLKCMTLGSMKYVARRIWDSIQVPNTVIARVNTFSQGKYNYLDFLDRKKRPKREFKITGADVGKTESL